MSYATLDRVEAAGTSFQGVDFTETNLSRLNARNASFESAKLVGTEITNSTIENSNMRNLTAKRNPFATSIRDSMLRGNDFTGSDFQQGYWNYYDVALYDTVAENNINFTDRMPVVQSEKRGLW